MIILYTLAAFGLAFVIGFAKISLWIREKIAARSYWLITLLECPACVGFWIGFVVGITDCLEMFPDGPWHPINAVLLAFYTVGSNFFLAQITKLDGAPPTWKAPDNE